MTTTCPALFAVHDAGLVALPGDLVKLRDARHRAAEHLRELTAPGHPLDARERVTADTVEAFTAGKPLPDLAPIVVAEQAGSAFAHQLEIGRNALAALERRIGEAVTNGADDLLATVLRPPFEATLAA